MKLPRARDRQKLRVFSSSQFVLQFADGGVATWQKQNASWEPLRPVPAVQYELLLLLRHLITYFRPTGTRTVNITPPVLLISVEGEKLESR